MNWLHRSHPKTVLALTFNGSQLDAVVLRRTNGHADVQKSLRAPLTLDLLHNEVELVGQEIRNQLDAAGVKERRCVVGVPASWVITLHTRVPEMPEEDVASFVELEAERGFPCALDELQVSRAEHRSPDGTRYFTQMAVPRDHLARLEAVLSAAQLKPASFALGLAALPGTIPGIHGAIAAVVTEASVDVLIASGGGVVALRTLEGAFESEGGEKRVQSDLVGRELRISLGQLPVDIRESISAVKVLGAGRFGQQLAEELRPRARSLGLGIELVTALPAELHGIKIAGDTSAAQAVALAAQFLAGRGISFEFLPPKPRIWEQFASRYSSKRLAYAGMTAGAVALIVGLLFLVQQIQLSSLRSEWAQMKAKVYELEDVHGQIRKFRPWYDESLTSLSILRRLTEAFPEDGAVTAKSLEIRSSLQVSVAGTARDNPALLKTLDQLRAGKEISDVKVDQIRGKTPMQFTFNFQWGEARKP